jgi:predicted nucleic acid-binding protein
VIYCDTSIIVAALTGEVHSDIAKPWLLAQERRTLVISDWSLTEFANTITRKHRRGDLDDHYRAVAEDAWNALRTEFTTVTVTRSHFLHAANLADLTPGMLRSGDALHLAITLDHGCDLATLDRDLAAAARALGVAVCPATP